VGRGGNVVLILKSRTLAESVVEGLGLEGYYRAPKLRDAAAILRGSTKILAKPDGSVDVTVEDKDPQKAAQIANTYPVSLNRHMIRFSSGLASRQRVFIVERLGETEKALHEAEETLRKFQEKNRVVVPSAQTTEGISVASGLRGQLVAAEIDLKNLLNFATDSNPEVVKLRRKIAELKRQIAQAQYGAGLDLPPLTLNPGHPQKEIYLPAVKVPETLLEFTRLSREVRVQETVYNLLTEQLEKAKIAEAQEAPVVHILDPALPPVAPKPLYLILEVARYGGLGLVIGIFLAFSADRFPRYWLEIKSRVISQMP